MCDYRTLILAALVCFIAFCDSRAQHKLHEDLTVSGFKARLDTIAGAIVVDLRTPDELRDGVIHDAMNIDFYSRDFRRRISKLDRTKPYFIYCARGGRSADALEIMEELGFSEVYNLADGFLAWKDAGLPVVPYKK